MSRMRDDASVLLVTKQRRWRPITDGLRLSIGEAVDRHVNGIEEHLARIEFNRQK
jgi:hypothetical protein